MTVAPVISTELSAVNTEAARPGWWRRMPTKAKAGVVLFGVFVLTAIIGPLVTPYDPSYENPSPGASMTSATARHLPPRSWSSWPRFVTASTPSRRTPRIPCWWRWRQPRATTSCHWAPSTS